MVVYVFEDVDGRFEIIICLLMFCCVIGGMLFGIVDDFCVVFGLEYDIFMINWLFVCWIV